jgi:hypothetical protein
VRHRPLPPAGSAAPFNALSNQNPRLRGCCIFVHLFENQPLPCGFLPILMYL